MKWLIINDLEIARSNLLFFFAANVINLICGWGMESFIAGYLYVYSCLMILYNDFQNKSFFFYSMFPRLRVYMILQKNISFMILTLFYTLLSFSIRRDGGNVELNSILVYLIIGNLLLLFFFFCSIAYAFTIVQLIGTFIIAVGYCILKIVPDNSQNSILELMILVLLISGNTLCYSRKDLYI